MNPETEMQIYQPDATVGELKLYRPPSEVMAEARAAAVELQKIIAAKKKPVMFNGEQYLELEDWEMLGHFYGYSAKVESTKYIEFPAEDGPPIRGFEASSLLLHERSGIVVGRAEAMCLNEEENWGAVPKYEWRDMIREGHKVWNEAQGKCMRERIEVGLESKPLFQLRSMAQTRASAKAFRTKLSWVAVLAGYQPTPAEEMDRKTIPESKNSLPEKLERKSESPANGNGASKLPHAVWCTCGHISGQHGAEYPHRCACDGNHWTNGHGSICDCQGFQAKPLTPSYPEPSQKPEASRAAPVRTQSPVAVISPQQARRFYAIWKGAGKTRNQVNEFLQHEFGIDDDRLIPAPRYKQACAWADGTV